MRPLLWKEIHDLRAWLVAGAALTGSLQLLVLARVLNAGFISMWMFGLMPVAAATAAIGLGVGQVARERHARTLDFLLVRPVSAGIVVWSKFITGTVVLFLLLAAIVALSYAGPAVTSDTDLATVREQVGLGHLLATLLPRFWFLYAVALFFSVLVDRSVKAAALAGIVAISLAALAVESAHLAPFSGFVYWLPFHEASGGLVEAAGNSWLSATTGLVYSCGAVLVTAASAMLLKRSPERYLGNRGLTVAGALVIAIAVASANASANRLPVLAPVGYWEFAADGEWDSAGIVAEGTLVAVTLEQSVRFLDFTQPSRPKEIAHVRIPAWASSADWSINRAAIADSSVFLVGHKKRLPADELEIAVVKPSGQIQAIPLGPMRPGDYASTPVPAGEHVYIAVTQDRECSLLAFDIASGRRVASLSLDRMRPELAGREEGSPPVRMLRRGGVSVPRVSLVPDRHRHR